MVRLLALAAVAMELTPKERLSASPHRLESRSPSVRLVLLAIPAERLARLERLPRLEASCPFHAVADLVRWDQPQLLREVALAAQSPVLRI
jgi:hypothetical protein